ncbi:hypothetical protein FO519_004782 [Halicephalobus sp. NKZ332]|nr:hypothetical protein FO519_004782 [Halicephalobus sp. NKZ332]
MPINPTVPINNPIRSKQVFRKQAQNRKVGAAHSELKELLRADLFMHLTPCFLLDRIRPLSPTGNVPKNENKIVQFPGLSRTDLLSQSGVPGFIVPLVYAGLSVSRIPLQRPGTSEEQADVIVQVASDESSYMTGSCVLNNGGAIVHTPPLSYVGIFFGGLSKIIKDSISGIFH